ncbi:MAG: hypothetical protein ABIN05_07830 [candidate division WOR-3 bacterium]
MKKKFFDFFKETHIYKLKDLMDFFGSYATEKFFRTIKRIEYIPKEVTVNVPQIVVPTVARVYHTELYIYDKTAVTYRELVKKEKRNFKGTAHYQEILIREVFREDKPNEIEGYEILLEKY